MAAIPKSCAELVLSVRKNVLRLTQAQFGRKIGRTQAVVSKYELGETDVPGDVVMFCIHSLGLELKEPKTPSTAQLISEVRQTLGGNHRAHLRLALLTLLNDLKD